jgi:hypothetical protein
MVSQALSSRRMGVGAAIVMPRMMLQALSSWHNWCCSCYRHATCGVVGIVIVPCMVSQALSSHRMGVGAAIVVLCMMLQAPLSWHDWCRSCHHHATRGVMGVVIRLQKRKLVETNKNKMYKQAGQCGACIHEDHDVVCAAVRGTVTWCMQQRRPSDMCSGRGAP